MTVWLSICAKKSCICYLLFGNKKFKLKTNWHVQKYQEYPQTELIMMTATESILTSTWRCSSVSNWQSSHKDLRESSDYVPSAVMDFFCLLLKDSVLTTLRCKVLDYMPDSLFQDGRFYDPRGFFSFVILIYFFYLPPPPTPENLSHTVKKKK